MNGYQAYKDLDAATEAALRASIERFGVLVPIVKDQHGNVLDGHQRARLADQVGESYPIRIIDVADDAEAREIARTLNEDRRAMPKAERLPVETHLREQGHSLRAIAGAVGVSKDTVANDLSGVYPSTPATTTGLDGKSYPARKAPPVPPGGGTTGSSRASVARPDKGRAATAERRSRIAELAAEGHTAEQIGALVGMTGPSVKVTAKRAGINLRADAVLGNTRRVDLVRVITKTVSNLEAEALSIGPLPGHLPLTKEQAQELAGSLAESLRAFRRLLRALEDIT